MQTNNMGNIVLGSPNLETSVAGVEILPVPVRVINLAFENDQACHIKVNDLGDYFYLKAGQGKLIDICTSLRVEEAGITFNWTGQKG